MKTTITKYCLVILIVAAGLLPATGVADLKTDPSGLFKSVLTPKADIRKPVSDLIVRQRFVTVRFEFMQTESSPPPELRLNLFDDILVRAVLDETAPGLSGGYGWTGHSANSAADQIVLVVSGGVLAGSLSIEGRYYQIRPDENDGHVVREIDTSLLAHPKDTLRSMSPSEIEVVSLVNRERAIEGLHDLSSDDRLTEAAQGHSDDMAANDYVSHDSLDGRSAKDRIVAAGYPCFECGENVAGGGIYSTPELVMEGWMASEGHRENILRERYCDIGVGHVYNPDSSIKHFWTQNFGRQPNVDTCPTADETDVEAPSSSSDSSDGEAEGASCFITTPW